MRRIVRGRPEIKRLLSQQHRNLNALQDRPQMETETVGIDSNIDNHDTEHFLFTVC